MILINININTIQHFIKWVDSACPVSVRPVNLKNVQYRPKTALQTFATLDTSWTVYNINHMIISILSLDILDTKVSNPPDILVSNVSKCKPLFFNKLIFKMSKNVQKVSNCFLLYQSVYQLVIYKIALFLDGRTPQSGQVRKMGYFQVSNLF